MMQFVLNTLSRTAGLVDFYAHTVANLEVGGLRSTSDLSARGVTAKHLPWRERSCIVLIFRFTSGFGLPIS